MLPLEAQATANAYSALRNLFSLFFKLLLRDSGEQSENLAGAYSHVLFPEK